MRIAEFGSDPTDCDDSQGPHATFPSNLRETTMRPLNITILSLAVSLKITMTTQLEVHQMSDYLPQWLGYQALSSLSSIAIGVRQIGD